MSSWHHIFKTLFKSSFVHSLFKGRGWCRGMHNNTLEGIPRKQGEILHFSFVTFRVTGKSNILPVIIIKMWSPSIWSLFNPLWRLRIHAVFFIRDTDKMRLVLSQTFFQYKTSFVPYLSLNFSKNLDYPLNFTHHESFTPVVPSFFRKFRLCPLLGGI